MGGEIVFAPLIGWSLIAIVAVITLGLLAFATWQRLAGWWLRGLGAAVLLLALANPSIQCEDREPLTDIVVVVVDESASQRIDVRPNQTAAALARLEAEIASLPNTELRILPLGDAEGNEGTLLMGAVSEALADEPRARVAGVILLTDGQLHDVEAAPNLPAPLHALLTGEPDDWDRRLVVQNAPAFAILGEEVTLTLRVEDQGGGEPAVVREMIEPEDGIPDLEDERGRGCFLLAQMVDALDVTTSLDGLGLALEARKDHGRAAS